MNTRRAGWPTVVALAVLAGLCLGGRPETECLAAAPPEVSTEDAQAAYQELLAYLSAHLAAHERGGRWQSDDSALLAWSCGQQLSALVDLYEATGDRKWLDQLVRYADAAPHIAEALDFCRRTARVS